MARDPWLPEHLQFLIDEKDKWQQSLESLRLFDSPYAQAIRDLVNLPSNQPDPYQILSGHLAPPSYRQASSSSSTNSRSAELEAEVAQLKKDIRQKLEALRTQTADSETKDRELAVLREDFVALQTKQQLAYLLNRVSTAAHSKLISDEQFRLQFQSSSPCNAYVISIDIRRSTELMLKAREPRLFAEFMITLAGSLRQLILENLGVFDKFTGDGVLAFFPDFYSGEDAGFRALITAAQCHALFVEHYRRSRAAFTSVLLDTGLGIGIDYGRTQIVEIGGEFTVVGVPVVYACRMSSAEAGCTYVNQTAFDQLFSKYSTFDFTETELTIKHEGKTLAYSVRPNGKEFTPAEPMWKSEHPPQAEG